MRDGKCRSAALEMKIYLIFTNAASSASSRCDDVSRSPLAPDLRRRFLESCLDDLTEMRQAEGRTDNLDSMFGHHHVRQLVPAPLREKAQRSHPIGYSLAKIIPKNYVPKSGPKNNIFSQKQSPQLGTVPKLFPKIRVRAPCFDRAKEFLGNTKKF